MQYIVRHGVCLFSESRRVYYHQICQGRFVHIVPDAIDTLVEQSLVQVAPPCSHAALREIGEDTCPWPDIACEEFSILVVTEVILFHTLLVHKIVFIDLYPRINDRDQAQPLCVEIYCHFLWMRKSLSVPGKITITIHVVYVEPDSIAGMLALAHLCRHVSYLLLRHITPATEVVSNSPARRKWHAPGKFCVLPQHVRRCGAGKKVGDQTISLYSHAYF